MPSDPIRIRVTARDFAPASSSPRETFWSDFRQGTDSNRSIASFEGQLCRSFGKELRSALLHELAAPLRALDSELFPNSMSDFERFMFRFMDGPRPERDWYGYQITESFARLLEQRQQFLRENPSLRSIQERLAAAAGVVFSTRIAGYSSLNLDVVPGSFKHLAVAFENDFDSFRVFLESFVPVAFAEVFSEASADRLSFAVTIPASAEQAFLGAAQSGLIVQNAPVLPQPAASGSHGSSRERAEWLWRLANGSLLLPVLLGLFVMYQGMKMLTEIRAVQYESLKPVLEHQLKLLEEDRHRLVKGVTPVPPPPPLTLPPK